MKKLFKKFFLLIIGIDTIWNIFDPIYLWLWKIKHQRILLERKKSEKEINEKIFQIFKEPIVLNGIFKGMKYPQFRSRNSSLYNKLIGSYEMELYAVFEEAINTNYTEILDIGCAEGYYAVGMAMRQPNAKIYAYDIEAESRQLTKKMAELNEVSDRVIVKDYCGPETLRDFHFTGKALIISDCEGYEKKLFTKDNLPNLKNCDLIIETHDAVDIYISTYLEELFSQSHDISIIPSIGDIVKVKTYKFKEVEGLDMHTKYRIFEEGRREINEWLIIKART